MAEVYGTIGILPLKEWDANTQYDLLNLVSYNGSSYVAHTRPPVGTLPTNTAYWQVSAQGGGKATADTLGTVKPDGTTLEVDEAGILSAKLATQATAGIVKGSDGIKVAEDGSIDVDTYFQEATELANIIAGESIAQVLGKVSKSIAKMMSLDQNALLKNMLTSIDVNDANKIPTAAYIHTLVERIGMGAELTTGGNLTEAVNILNRDLEYRRGVIKLNTSRITRPDYSADQIMEGHKMCYTIRFSAKTIITINTGDVIATLPYQVDSLYIKSSDNLYQFLFYGVEIKANTVIPAGTTFEIFSVLTGI